MAQQTSEEKSLPPSDRKLRKAREEGDFDRSQDVVSAVVILALILLFGFGADYFFQKFQQLFDLAAVAALSGESLTPRDLEQVWGVAIDIVAPVLGVATAATFVGALISNRGLVVALKPILPNLDRINPVQGFIKLFSLRNLLEFVKSLVKTALFMAAAGAAFYLMLRPVLRAPLCDARCAADLAWLLLAILAGVAAVFFILSALIDMPLQKWLFARDKRMTHSEMKRERKEQYGDPHVRGRLKTLRRELLGAPARGASGVPASGRGPGVRFVVADGGVQAVALYYDGAGAGVPFVDVKARGEAATRLLEDAAAAREVIVADPVLTAALMSYGQAGEAAPRGLFDQLAKLMIRHGLLGR